MSILKSKIAKNASWLIAGKVVQAILAFIINMLTARYLGPSTYGVISYAASIVAFVVPIMNLGFSNVLVQEFTNFPDEEGKILGTSIALSTCSAIACMVGVASYTFLVDATETETNVVVILYSVMLIAQAFELIQYWFQYKLLSKYMSLVSLAAYLIVSLYKFVLLVLKKNVYWFAISNSADYIIIAVVLLLIYKKLGGEKIAFDWSVAKRMFGSSKHYIISSLMVTVFAQTDKIMIKLMIDETHVGLYSAAVTCATMSSFIFSAIIDSFRPVIFQAKKDKDAVGYDNSLIKMNSFVIYLALLQSVFLTIFATWVINLLYGKDFSEASLALQIIVWFTSFSYLGATRNVWILAENKQKYLWILNSSGALLNVVLNFLFIPMWGIYGAAIASLITQIFTNIVMNVIVWPLRHNVLYIFSAMNPKVMFRSLK